MAFEEINNGEFEGDPSAGSIFEAFEKVNRNAEKTVEKVPGKNLSSENYTLAEKTKLVNIEEGATRDQIGSEIKALYEAEPNTNAFTNVEQAKLADIEAGATADQTAEEIGILYETLADVNRYTNAEKAKLSSIVVSMSDGSSQVVVSPSLVKGLYESNTNTNAFTDTAESKLAGIEAGAQVNLSPGSLKLDYEGNPDTNAFTDAEKAKLATVEANATADQTGSEIKIAYEGNANTNAFTDARRDKLDNLTIDGTLDDFSTNPIENRAVKIVMDTKADAIDVYTIADLQTDPGVGLGDKVHWNNITNAPSFGSEMWLSPVGSIAERDALDTSSFNGSEAILVQDAGDGKPAQYVWTGSWIKIADVDWAAMTDAQIKSAYERNADTNAFSNAEKLKLGAVDLSVIESAVTGDTIDSLALVGVNLNYTTVANSTPTSISLASLITTDTNTFVTGASIVADDIVMTMNDLTTVTIDISSLTTPTVPTYTANSELAAIAASDITLPLGAIKTGIPVAAGKWLAYAINVIAGSTVRVFAQSPGGKAGVAYYRADGVLGAYDDSSVLDKQDVTFVAAYSGVYYICATDPLSVSDVSLNIGYSVDAVAP